MPTVGLLLSDNKTWVGSWHWLSYYGEIGGGRLYIKVWAPCRLLWALNFFLDPTVFLLLCFLYKMHIFAYQMTIYVFAQYSYILFKQSHFHCCCVTMIIGKIKVYNIAYA